MSSKRSPWITMVFSMTMLFLALPSFAQPERRPEPQFIFYRAVTSYESGRYDEAIGQFSLLLEKGLESGPLYYNLGNCYFKKGLLGQALLNYEKAKRIIPRDSDLQWNYEYAKSRIREYPADPSRVWYEKITDRILELLSVDDLTILLSLAYLLGMAVIVASLYLTWVKRYRTLLLSFLILVLLLSGLGLYQKAGLLGKEAVVIEGKVEARFEPFAHATAHFALYEGTKVRVLASKKDWVRIQRADRKAGWVKASSVGVF